MFFLREITKELNYYGSCRVIVVQGNLMRSEWPITAGVNNTTISLKLKVNTRDQHQAREKSRRKETVILIFRHLTLLTVESILLDIKNRIYGRN